ncbi:MAG TPA: hypothetical protein VGM26_12665 [Rhizomicrobium sp.]
MTPVVVRTLLRSLVVLTAITLVTAWFSELFYFPDEHYQVLEFMGYKLGITPGADLPWEFAARIRPWMQPLIYFAITKPLMWMGVHDMFVIAFVLRLLTGLFSVAALALFARAVLQTMESEDEKLAFARYLPLFGFLPYLFVRTASETMAAAFFAMGLALALRRGPAAALALAGLLCGLAFECRYQAGIMATGLFAWLAIIGRVRPVALAGFAAGGLVAVVLGALADRWGYGTWVFPPWDYLQFNVLGGGAEHQFGREPIFAYLYLMPAQFFFAITLVLMAALVAMWMRNPRHAVTWITLPFVLVHVLVAHKEARFLFPLAIVATAFPVLGFSPHLPRWRAFFARVWTWRHGGLAKVTTALSVIFMAYLAVYPFGIRPHMPMAKYLYRHDTGTIYSFSEPFQSYPLYRPPSFQSRKLADSGALDVLLRKGPVYLMAQTPVPLGIPGAKVTLVYSEFPLARFGFGAAGARYIQGYSDFAARERWLKLLPLYWYTLYRVERSATMRS